jgi:antitoxin YefM
MGAEVIMEIFTLNMARANLDQLIEQVIADSEPAIVVTDKGERVVLISLDEYNSWKETLYLLSSPANAEHLRHSIQEAQEKRWLEKDISEP